jgi:hypothetical protein
MCELVEKPILSIWSKPLYGLNTIGERVKEFVDQIIYSNECTCEKFSVLFIAGYCKANVSKDNSNEVKDEETSVACTFIEYKDHTGQLIISIPVSKSNPAKEIGDKIKKVLKGE